MAVGRGGGSGEKERKGEWKGVALHGSFSCQAPTFARMQDGGALAVSSGKVVVSRSSISNCSAQDVRALTSHRSTPALPALLALHCARKITNSSLVSRCVVRDVRASQPPKHTRAASFSLAFAVYPYLHARLSPHPLYPCCLLNVGL